jgi:hypothetical protein
MLKISSKSEITVVSVVDMWWNYSEKISFLVSFFRKLHDPYERKVEENIQCQFLNEYLNKRERFLKLARRSRFFSLMCIKLIKQHINRSY